jgi:hypothetical protein
MVVINIDFYLGLGKVLPLIDIKGREAPYISHLQSPQLDASVRKVAINNPVV